MFYGICQWCNEKPIKFKGYKTCSRSCGSSLRWFKMKASGKVLNFNKHSESARKTLYAKRVQAEFEKHCLELKIIPTKAIRALYIRARNRGYLNGWSTANKRIIKNGIIIRRSSLG